MSIEGPDDDAELAAWLEQNSLLEAAPPIEPKHRHRLRSLLGATLAVFGPSRAMFGMILDEDNEYVALIRSVADERSRDGRVTFDASGQTLELDPFRPMDSTTRAALVMEIHPLL